MPFVIPVQLKTCFQTLATDAEGELAELLHLRPDLAPLPFESQALKERIEQTKSARRSGGGGSGGTVQGADADQVSK